jgi:alkanesulfonate monooxygenase SsuD/methylene tetrahydromethanopterin reductase-like flavin-dependent oxidoreductase (luciferase family)
VLGIGSSTETVVERWMGLRFERPLARTRETALGVKALLAGERVGGMRLHRVPPTPVPVYLAALGERMLGLAGEVADGVVFFMVGPRMVPDLVGATGRPLDSVARVVLVAGRDHHDNLALARRFIAGYAVVAPYARLLARQGFSAEVANVQELWSTGDRHGAAEAVSDEVVSELMLLATDPCLGERIKAYEESGLGTLDLWIMSPERELAARRRDVEHALMAVAPAFGKRHVEAPLASSSDGGHHRYGS